MALIYVMSPSQMAEWLSWVNSRPPVVADIAKRFPPNRLYRIKATGDRGPIVSINENGTLTMAITGEFNKTVFARNVFGLKPEAIEESDLPSDDEELGEALTEADDIDAFVNETRPFVLRNRLKEPK